MRKLASEYPFFCPNCGEARVIAVSDNEVYNCLKCGFDWKVLTRPKDGYTRYLASLPDKLLLEIYKAIHVLDRGLTRDIAAKAEVSPGMGSLVCDGKRKSAPVDKALIQVLRERLEAPVVVENVSNGNDTSDLASVEQ